MTTKTALKIMKGEIPTENKFIKMRLYLSDKHYIGIFKINGVDKGRYGIGIDAKIKLQLINGDKIEGLLEPGNTFWFWLNEKYYLADNIELVSIEHII